MQRLVGAELAELDIDALREIQDGLQGRVEPCFTTFETDRHRAPEGSVGLMGTIVLEVESDGRQAQVVAADEPRVDLARPGGDLGIGAMVARCLRESYQGHRFESSRRYRYRIEYPFCLKPRPACPDTPVAGTDVVSYFGSPPSPGSVAPTVQTVLEVSALDGVTEAAVECRCSTCRIVVRAVSLEVLNRWLERLQEAVRARTAIERFTMVQEPPPEVPDSFFGHVYLVLEDAR